MSTSASVIVCTRNRPQHLREILESLSKQRLSNGMAWEILVVDNGPENPVAAVVQEVARRSTVEIKYDVEHDVGLARARNRGAKDSAGEIIAYLDDDALPAERWLEELLSPYEDRRVIGVGGTIIQQEGPAGSDEVPRHLYSVPYARHPGCLEWSEVNNLHGSNMSFRREAFAKVAGFDVRLGRVGSCMLAGEENDLITRLRTAMPDMRILFNPRAIVYHKLLPCQLGLEALTRRYYCGGIGLAVRNRKLPVGERGCQVLQRCLKLAAYAGMVTLLWLWRMRPRTHIAYYKVHTQLGYLKEMLLGPRCACRQCPAFQDRRRVMAGGGG